MRDPTSPGGSPGPVSGAAGAVTGPKSGPEQQAESLSVGDELELEIGPVAHGGVCVARIARRVVFVRYALPGERAVVRITEVKRGSFGRGEAIRIVRADPRRVRPPCGHFGPGGCGGCDFQHAAPDLQRELKAAVVAEQLRRLAGIEMSVPVEEVPGGGFGWRTRVRWAVSAPRDAGTDSDTANSARTVGPRRYRSHEPVAISSAAPCLIAAAGLSESVATLAIPAGADEVSLVRGAGAGPNVAYWRRRRLLAARTGSPAIERVGDRQFQVLPAGFWQAHTAAAEVLTAAVRAALADFDLSGAGAWDLYGGVGLFAATLAGLVGVGGEVVTVESERSAATLAAANLADLPQVRAIPGRVADVIPHLAPQVRVVVLDPPRTGAGEVVCQAIAERAPAVVVYVACDPAALARDTAILTRRGYELAGLRAFDLFPQTHHVECVARFIPRRVPA